jgi:Na+-transporting methylmalonyl-CoA/oxaloacetate decarboxylase gamma subunit
MKVFLFLFIPFLIAVVMPCMAQQPQQQLQQPVASDTVEPPPTKQELANKKIANREPNKAALMSAILPGSGQYYNKKYWKVPIPLIGLAATAFYGHKFCLEMGEYGKAAKNAANGNTTAIPDNLRKYSSTQLSTLQDDARRYMYMNILAFTGIYALNIIDAYVDAHLKEFDIDDKLSITIKPLFYTTNYSHLATGLTLSLRFK